jgi:hypothetical protein
MKLIAHRGNTNGSNTDIENSPKQIDKCIEQGYNVEIDVRYDDNSDTFWLGHDTPDYSVTWKWLNERVEYFWIHCKDIGTLHKFSVSANEYNYFWHQNDDFTLTSKNYIWTYPGKPFTTNSVIVCPEWGEPNWDSLKYEKCYGICTDFVEKIK